MASDIEGGKKFFEDSCKEGDAARGQGAGTPNTTGVGAVLGGFLQSLGDMVAATEVQTKTFIFERQGQEGEHEVSVRSDVATMEDVLRQVSDGQLLAGASTVKYFRRRAGQAMPATIEKPLDQFLLMNPALFFDTNMYPSTEFTVT